MLAGFAVPPAVLSSSPHPPTSVDALSDSPAIRQAGRGPLSLALIDARNHTLHLLARYEEALRDGWAMPRQEGIEPPARVAGHVAWLAEWWLGRNPQRGLGARSPAEGLRLASFHPQADAWFGPVASGPWPELDEVRAYMLEQLESTLDLLDRADEDDDALYLFRAMLHHEDARGEQLVQQAQALGLALPLAPPAALATREPLWFPATRWVMGSPSGGFVPALEQPQLTIDVPAFEIDAQPVTWAQYIEFVDDGGYDQQALWHPQGWEWLQQAAMSEGRRGPRHVEQIGVASGAVLQTWFGRAVRMSGLQPVTHVTWWEADAWARWAGRRLPTEVEWEIAAVQGQGRGLRWGDVLEWSAGSLRPREGYAVEPWASATPLDPRPWWGQARVLRGASVASRQRMKHPRARRFDLPHQDMAFTGFRTCAV
jgi:iron(II)-dependent oxidoreductase